MAINKFDPIKEEFDKESQYLLEETRKRLNITKEDIDKAREYIKKSIAVNPNMYNELVRLISHPSAIMRVRIIPDSKKLQIKLNKVILFNRITFNIGLIASIIGIFAKMIVLITIGILIICLWYVFLQRWQTQLNIELGARLFAIDGKEDPDKFEESIKAMDELYRSRFGERSISI